MRTSTKIVSALAIAGSLSVAAPLAANAAGYYEQHGFYSTYTICHNQETKAAYNNSYVRVSDPCSYFAGYGWAFTTRSVG